MIFSRVFIISAYQNYNFIIFPWNWNSIFFFTGYHNYTGSGEVGDCYDKCFNEDKSNFCRNEGICLKVSLFDEKIVL